METTETGRLKPAHVKFASLIALGYEQAEAYRRAFKAKTLDAQTIAVRASRLAKNDAVADRARQFLAEYKLEQLDSIGQAYSELLQSLRECKAAENWTAYASLMRQRLQCLGMLKDNITLSAESRLTDDQILDKLAGKDEHKRAMFKAILGQSDDYVRA